MPSPRTTTRRSMWPKLLLAVAAPLVFFAVLEGGLRLGGFGRDPHFFIPDEQPGMWRTNPRFTETYFPASFGLKPVNFRLPKVKPAGTTRIFVLGESAAMGVPEPAFGLAPQLQAQLRAVWPEARIEVFNLAVTAINSHVIRGIAAQAADFDPDLFVIYMGNNEVVGPYGPSSVVTAGMPPRWLIRTSLALRTSRTGQLLERAFGAFRPKGAEFREWGGMEMFAGKTVAADDPRLAAVYDNLAANLGAILDIAEKRGIKVVLSTVAVNIRDCAPFASVGPKSAEEAFQRGRAAEVRGDSVAARAAYLEALQLDALRFRADARLNEIIRTTAHDHRAALADAAVAMGSDGSSRNDPAGRSCFFEHVHLTWEGNYDLARLVAAKVDELLQGRREVPANWLDAAGMAGALGFTPYARLAQLQAMDELTARPPFTGQSSFGADRARLEREIAWARVELSTPVVRARSRELVAAAAQRDPRNPTLLFQAAKVELLAGDPAGATARHEELAELAPFSAETATHRAVALQHLGRKKEAEDLLRRAIETEPYFFQSYGLLARFWVEDGRLEHAIGRFAEWVREMTASRMVRGTYAQLLARAEKWEEAEFEWREMLARVPDDETALEPLAARLAEQGKLDAAVELMERAFAHNPRNYANNARLVQVAELRGDAAAMVKYMRALAASGSVNAQFHLDLAEQLRRLGRSDERRVALRAAVDAAKEEGNAEVERRAREMLGPP